MLSSRFVRQPFLILCLFIIASGVSARAETAKEYQPEVGQHGRDVVWVPTCQELVDKMLDMAKVTDQDYVIDLGSGDGRLVITAAKRGASALGIEYNPDMVALAERHAAAEKVKDKARFINADIFESDFSQATVVTLFLLDELNLRLRPQILNLKPGTRVVSNTFRMGEWKADQTASLSESGCADYYTAYLWIVPAKVEGAWKFSSRQDELTLNQTFQIFSGELKSGKGATPVIGKLDGNLITFSVGNDRYTGRVSGSTMEGTVESGGRTAKWTAIKAQ
jgi:hypothetical protein